MMILYIYKVITSTSLVTQTVKNLPAVQKTWVQCLGLEGPLEQGVATLSSIQVITKVK